MSKRVIETEADFAASLEEALRPRTPPRTLPRGEIPPGIDPADALERLGRIAPGESDGKQAEGQAEAPAAPAGVAKLADLATTPAPPATPVFAAPGQWLPVEAAGYGGPEPFALSHVGKEQRATLTFRTGLVADRDRRPALVVTPARAEVLAELKKLMGDPESPLSRTKRLAAEAAAVNKSRDVAAAKVAELEAKRNTLTAEAPKGMAAKLVGIDKDLAEARKVLAERQAEADALRPLFDAARAEAEALAGRLADAHGTRHFEDLKRQFREKLEAVAAKVGADLEELAAIHWTLYMRWRGVDRQAVSAGVLDEALAE